MARGRGGSSLHLFALHLTRRRRRTSRAHGMAFDERPPTPVRIEVGLGWRHPCPMLWMSRAPAATPSSRPVASSVKK